jgi:hypothetical protein
MKLIFILLDNDNCSYNCIFQGDHKHAQYLSHPGMFNFALPRDNNMRYPGITIILLASN